MNSFIGSYSEPPPEEPRKERRQQQAEELCAASIRALTGYNRIRYRGHRLEMNGQRIPIGAPHLKVDADEDDTIGLRGAADGVAMRLLHSDLALHQQLMPKTRVAQTLFEILEQIRVEQLAGNAHPGVQSNLDYRFAQWINRYQQSKMMENQIGFLIYTVIQMVWSRLSGNPPSTITEDLIESERARLAPLIGTHLLGLRKNTQNQTAFAEHALSIAHIVDGITQSIKQAYKEDTNQESDDDDLLDTNLWVDLDDELAELNNAGAIPAIRTAKQLADQLSTYRTFNSDHDKLYNITQLVRDEQLKEYREQLDRRIRHQGINIPRLARKLTRLLAQTHRNGWNFAQEEGQLDATRLPQLIATPSERRIFRQERQQPHTACQVSFLIDNSGSMKAHIESIALLVDSLCHALDQAGARTEVLGFTTNTWNGGKPHMEWMSKGRPKNPGRLNELCHIIYKTAEQSWRKSRPMIAGMFKPSLFREAVDGESLLWAAQRLNQIDAERKILIVISDGCPMDGATYRTNPADYLDQHLQQVAALIESQGDIELYALGVGLDLSNFYQRNLALDLSHSLDNATFDEVLQLLSKTRKRWR